MSEAPHKHTKMITLKGFKRTASSNTLLHGQKVKGIAGQPFRIKIDYLTVRFEGLTQQDLDLLLDFVSNEVPIARFNGRTASLAIQQYSNRIQSLDGSITGGYSECSSPSLHNSRVMNQSFDAFLKLSGKYWERLGTRDQVRRFWGLMLKYRAIVTRFDVAVDDLSGRLFIAEDFKAAHDNADFTGVKKRSLAADYDLKTDAKRETLYFGSRNSMKFYRFYKHGDYNRLELELKGDCARQLADQLLSLKGSETDSQMIERRFISCLGAAVSGNIKFIKRKRDENGKVVVGHADRCQYLPFWKKILKYIRKGVPTTRKAISGVSIGKSRNWLLRQVIPTIAVFREAFKGKFGNSWITEISTMLSQFDRDSRWGSRHDLMVETFRLELSAVA